MRSQTGHTQSLPHTTSLCQARTQADTQTNARVTRLLHRARIYPIASISSLICFLLFSSMGWRQKMIMAMSSKLIGTGAMRSFRVRMTEGLYVQSPGR